MHTWTCKLICMRCSLNGAWRSMHTEYLPLFGGRIDTNQSRHWFHGAATTREMRQLRVLFFRTVPLLLIVYPIFSFAATSSIPYDLIVYQQPGSTTGGEPCTPQPVLRAKDANGNWVVSGSKGLYRGYMRTSDDLLTYAVTVINKNPIGIARVYQYNMTTQERMDTFMPRADFFVTPEGYLQANFSGVHINEIANGYSLHFIAYDSSEQGTYQMESETFNVLLGPMYKVMYTIPEGTMTGGLPFRPNPALATTDRGGNVIAWDQTTTFRVVQLYGPGKLSSNIKGDYNHTVVNGVATFLGLNFDKKGYPYKLRYFTSAPVWPNWVDSINLTVGVGHADFMTIVQAPDGARGGIPFIFQPCILVKDRGGNILIDDDHSTITASIKNNPGDGTLKSVIPITGPFKQYRLRNDAEDSYTVVPHTIQLEDGAVNFTGMSIDKVAREYTLRFLIRAGVGNYYGWTGSFYVDSPTFHVTHGDPTSLAILRPPGDAWAGGQPFRVQPEIGIKDAGDNIMTPDSTSTITAVLTKNPSGTDFLGKKTLQVSLGQALFEDLQLNMPGRGYVITWYTSAGNFNVSYTLDVVKSTEWELYQSDRQPGDMMGWSAGVYGELAIVGAIGEDRPVDEVQIIKSFGTESTLTREVQIVTTLATWRPEVQSLKFSCAAGSSVARMYQRNGPDFITQFSLSWNTESFTPYPPHGTEKDAKHGYKFVHKGECSIGTEVDVGPKMGAQECFDACKNNPAYFGFLVRPWDQRCWCELVKSRSQDRVNGCPSLNHPQKTDVLRYDIGYFSQTKLTRIFEMGMPGENFAEYIEDDIPEIGKLKVSGHDAEVETGCGGAMEYRITFMELQGEVDQLIVDTVSFTPDTVNGSLTVTTVIPAVQIEGFFQLYMPKSFHEGHVGPVIEESVTNLLPYNISAEGMAAAVRSLWRPLSKDLPVEVSRTGPDYQRGYTWYITFHAQGDLYNPPQMMIGGFPDFQAYSPGIYSAERKLFGFKSRGYVKTLKQGVGPCFGTFRIAFRGYDEHTKLTQSDPISFNATATEVESKLEKIGSIENVEVERSGPDATAGYTWTITFKTSTGQREGWDAVRYVSPYDLRLDTVGNLKPLVADISGLAGTGRSVQVSYLHNSSRTTPWDAKRLGNAGEEAGAAYIYHKLPNHAGWGQEFKLRARNTDSFDHFGFDTAIWKHTVAVSAPHAEDLGEPESQSFVCSADSGDFTLTFRNHTTIPISHKSTAKELESELERLESITDVEVAIYAHASRLQKNATICTNHSVDSLDAHTVLVTFHYPMDGDLPPMQADVSHADDVSPLVAPPVRSLVGWARLLRGSQFGEVKIKDNVVKGTAKLRDKDARGLNTGMVYIFHRDNATSLSSSWTQEARISPPDYRVGGAEFGYSLALIGPDDAVEPHEKERKKEYTLLIGSPEDDTLGDGAGMVYIYKSRENCLVPCIFGDCCKRQWYLFQNVSFEDMVCGLSAKGSAVPFKCPLDGVEKLPPRRFGHCVSISGPTIAIGEAPHQKIIKKGQHGYVYTMRRANPLATTDIYIPDQMLKAWDRETPINPRHGGDEFGTSVGVDGEVLVVGAPGRYGKDEGGLYQAGAAYIFKRATHRHSFMPEQILIPTERGLAYRFGRQVRTHESVVLVNAHVEYKGKKSTTREVQEIFVAGKGQKNSLGGWWRIGWQYRQSIRKPELAGTGMFIWSSVNKHNKPYTGSSVDRLEIGTLVEAERTNDEKLYPGKIVRVNSDNTYSVVYKDGHYEEYLRRYQLRPLDREIRTRDHRTKNELTETEAVPYNIEASALRRIMMQQLGTGLIKVTRSHVDEQGGYTWTITFNRVGNVPPLIPRSALTGPGAYVGQRTIREPIKTGSGASYLFTRNPIADIVARPILHPNPWIEQCMFHPKLHQESDMFGFSGLALRLPSAIVGSVNRDEFTSFANSGVGYMFDLQFMDFSFEKKAISSLESVTNLPITVNRCARGCKYSKLNDTSHIETVIGDGADSGLYPIRIGGRGVDAMYKCQDPRGCKSSAIGRNDCRVSGKGSNECLFVKSNAVTTEESHYDVRARSDYAPQFNAVQLNQRASSYTFNATITNDFLYEYPDEILNVRLTSPGMEPSYGGDLWSVVTIENDGDGAYGTRGYSEKLFANPVNDPQYDIHDDARYGFTLSIEDTILATSAPHAHVTLSGQNKILYAGVVVIHVRVNGVWIKDATICSPTPVHGGHFGEAVALDSKIYSVKLSTSQNSVQRKLPIVAVSAPGQAKVYIFQRYGVLSNGKGDWRLETNGTLSHPEASQPGHLFGGENALDIFANFVAVGARGCERVFLFRRSNVSLNNSMVTGGWEIFQVLQSSQYTQRTLIDDSLAVVNFDAHRLKHPPPFSKQSVVYITPAEFGASVALEDDTLIVGSPSGGYQGELNLNEDATWDQDIHYHGTGTVFVFGWIPDLNGSSIDSPGSWIEHSALFAPDKMAADRFGHSVALSGDTVIVGAPGDELKPQTTWDFETGNLAGWTKTGDAFDFQPTQGDNSYFRYVYGHTKPIKNMYGDRTGLEGDELRTALFHYYGGDPQRSNYVGRYWIGTFENHHKNTTDDGKEQGDRPQGTLESEVFQIRGDYISFMIGGGCEITEEFVELLVDGEGSYMATSIISRPHPWSRHSDDTTSNLYTVLRATGKCTETMERVKWNVRKWIGRSAKIRVVDRSSSRWAHINFDDVRFSWHEPTQNEQRTKDEGAHSSPGCGQGQCGTNAGQNAGAAYVFRRRDGDRYVTRNTLNIYEPCEIDCDAFGCYVRPNPNRYSCKWEYSQKLQPSDRRPNQKFGYTVAFDTTTGTVAVGSRFSRTVDFYNRDSGDSWWHTLDTQFTGGSADSASGAVYVFSREAEYRSGQGTLLKEPTFNNTEHVKLQPWDASEYMLFGATTGIGVNGWSIAVGAPGDLTGGSVYVLDTEFQRFRFKSKVVHVDEGAFESFSFVEVKVLRVGDLSGTAHIGYATSDITAIGVNADIFYKCQKYFNYERRPQACGDYLMAAGELTFAPTQFDQTIRIEIMDDWCHERYGEFFRIQLFLIGGPAIIGEKYATVVRIDDDDLSHVENIKNIDYCRQTHDDIPGTLTPQLRHTNEVYTAETPSIIARI